MPRSIVACAAACGLVSISVQLGAQETSGVRVTVEGLRSAQGQLIVCLWSERRGFPDCREGDGVPRHIYPVTARSMGIDLPLAQAGQYAVTVIHDENRNGKLNQNFIGMPTEGVGVSNNTGGMPRFNRSLVELAPGGAITVQMRYLFD